MTNQKRTQDPGTEHPLSESVDAMIARAKRDAILQAASGAVIVLDSKGFIISFNSNAETQFSVTQKIAIETHVDKILNIREETSQSFYEWLKLLDLEAKISHRVVLKFNKANGSSELAEVTVGKAPIEHWTSKINSKGLSDNNKKPKIEDRNDLYQYICIIRPLSTFKDSQIEDALKYLSHTLKTPLSGILGLISLALNENDLPDLSRKYLERATKSGESLAYIIESTLNNLNSKPLDSNTIKKRSKHAKEELSHKGRFSGKRILVVEDNVTNQIIAKGMLKKFGIKPDIANNGEEAIIAVIENTYDLILMDCNMPVMDGYTATKKIRDLPEPKNTIPIIAVTATPVPSQDSFCKTNKLDGYIAKPFRLEDIYHSLHLWLN